MSRTMQSNMGDKMEDGGQSVHHTNRDSASSGKRHRYREAGSKPTVHSLRPRHATASQPRPFDRNPKHNSGKDKSVRNSCPTKVSLRPFKELRALLESSVITEKDLLNADGVKTRTRLQRAKQRPAVLSPSLGNAETNSGTRLKEHSRKTTGHNKKIPSKRRMLEDISKKNRSAEKEIGSLPVEKVSVIRHKQKIFPPPSIPVSSASVPVSSKQSKVSKNQQSAPDSRSPSHSLTGTKRHKSMRRSKRLADVGTDSPVKLCSPTVSQTEEEEASLEDAVHYSSPQPADVENTVILDHSYSKPFDLQNMLSPTYEERLKVRNEDIHQGRGYAFAYKKIWKQHNRLESSHEQRHIEEDNEDDDDDDDEDDEDENVLYFRTLTSNHNGKKKQPESLADISYQQTLDPPDRDGVPTRHSTLPSTSRLHNRYNLAMKKVSSQSLRRLNFKNGYVPSFRPMGKINNHSHRLKIRSSSGCCSLLRSCSHAKCLKAKHERFKKRHLSDSTEWDKNDHSQVGNLSILNKADDCRGRWENRSDNTLDNGSAAAKFKRPRIDHPKKSEDEWTIRKRSQTHHHRISRGKQMYELASEKHQGPNTNEAIVPEQMMKDLRADEANNAWFDQTQIDGKTSVGIKTQKSSRVNGLVLDDNTSGLPKEGPKAAYSKFPQKGKRKSPTTKSNSALHSPPVRTWTHRPVYLGQKTASGLSPEANSRWNTQTPEQQNTSIKCWTYLLQLALGPAKSKEFWEEVERDFFKAQVKYIRHQNERDWPVNEDYLVALRYGIIWKHVRWHHSSVIKQLRRKIRQLAWLPASERYIWAKHLELAKRIDALVRGGNYGNQLHGNNQSYSVSTRTPVPSPRPITSIGPKPGRTISTRLTEVLQTIDEVEQQLDLTKTGPSYDTRLLEDILSKLQGSSMQMMPLGGKRVMVPIPNNEELCEALLRDVHLSCLPLEVIEEYLPECVDNEHLATNPICHPILHARSYNDWNQPMWHGT